MPYPPLYVTPCGRIVRHRRRAALIALMEHMRVTLPPVLPASQRGR